MLKQLNLFTLLWVTAFANLSLINLPHSTHPGGKCLDGTQAGYYYEKGRDTSIFVIFLEGGGYCNTESTCDAYKRTMHGSSNDWPKTRGLEGGFLNRKCDTNPSFCEANHVYVPYCTGDTHIGTRHEKLDESFGLYFDGRLNFEAIIIKLIADHGMGNAEHVLLTGASAGGIGTLLNVDWLSLKLPSANVKAVPVAGWFFPRSIEDEGSSVYIPPNDYPHFAAGSQGNDMLEMVNTTSTPLWQVVPDHLCSHFEEDNPETCGIIDVMYKYIRSPIFTVQTQFDGEQIFFAFETPLVPMGVAEIHRVEDYIKMYGEAMRKSLQQIVDGDSIFPKPHPDGLFASSCILHGNPPDALIDGMDFITLAHDWFFQINRYESRHQLIEMCSNGERSLPCNRKHLCHYLLDRSSDIPVSDSSKTTHASHKM